MAIEKSNQKEYFAGWSANDLDVLGNGLEKSQKPKSIFRRALVLATRKGIRRGSDDGDGLGTNIKFKDELSRSFNDLDQV